MSLCSAGLFGENQQSFQYKANFDYFTIGNASTFLAYIDYDRYFSDRNSTLAAAGICAISRSFERVIPAPASGSVVRGVINNELYRAKVRAEGAAGSSAWVDIPVTVRPIITPPIAGASLFLDAKGLATSTRLARWSDLSGARRHAYNPTVAQQPAVARAVGEPTQGVVYDGSASDLIISDDNSLDFTSASTLQASVFIVYKPGA